MKIPRREGLSATLTTEAPSGLLNPEKVAAGGLGAQLEGLGEGIQGLASHFQKLRDSQEVTAAKIALSKRIEQIHIDTMKNPDIWEAGKTADAQIDDAVDKTSAMVSSGNAKIKFKDEAGLIAERKRAWMNSQLMSKQSQLYKGTFTDSMKSLADEYIKAGPQDQQIIKSEMARQYQEAVNTGGVEQAAAKSLYDATIKSLPKQQIDHDIFLANTMPDPVKTIDGYISELKKGDAGRYKDIPEGQRGAELKNLESARKRADLTVKERTKADQMVHEKDSALKYWNGALTTDEVQELFVGGHIRIGTYNQLMKGMASGEVATQPNPKEFSSMMDFVSDKAHSAQDIQDELLKREGSGLLTKEETRKIASMSLIPTEKDPVSAMSQSPTLDEMLTAQEKKMEIDRQSREKTNSFWSQLISHFNGNKEKAAEVAKETLSKTGPDDDLSKTAIKVINEKNVLSNPYIPKVPAKGQLMIDAKGNKAIVFPDGHYEEAN